MARKNLLKSFKMPRGINFEQEVTTGEYGKVVAYPFEPGFLHFREDILQFERGPCKIQRHKAADHSEREVERYVMERKRLEIAGE